MIKYLLKWLFPKQKQPQIIETAQEKKPEKAKPLEEKYASSHSETPKKTLYNELGDSCHYAYGDGSGRIENFVIDGRKYNVKEVFDILRKHKEKEDAEYIVCERCGVKYKGNSKADILSANLSEEVAPGTVRGYESTPYISGIQILSTCGKGAKIKMCDDCIEELVSWLFEIKVEDE